jgi:ubiquinone/menaquinone biosynthesis C-methylase UbiE
MNIEEAYTKWSATYDSDWNLTRDLDEQVTKNTLTNLRFKSIIEIGCGTGKNTSFLAQIGEKVHAIDFSEGMINKAKEKLQLDNATFTVADITKPWHCEDQSVDLIVCNLVLEHVENLSPIFSEAFRTLIEKGHFFISELHPFKQYQGTKANFQQDQEITEIPAFIHHISDFISAAETNGFALKSFKEWWHEEDNNKPPRLISFMFVKR